MIIRSANPVDADGIARVHIDAWRDAYRGQIPDVILDSLDVTQRADFWSEVLSAAHNVFVAVNESGIVGFCSLIPSRDVDADPRDVAEIATLYVSPMNWRQGVGRALFDHTVEDATAKQFTAVTLWVLASNRDAIRFYQAMGLTSDGATKSEQDPSGFTSTEIRMRRWLV